MGRRIMSAAAAGALVVAAACSDPPDRSSIPAPADWAETAETDPEFGTAGLTVPTTTTVPVLPEAEPWGPSSGLIVAAGPTGLRLLRPDGEMVAEVAADRVVTQPTWSRDGRRLAATVIDPTDTTAQVAILDIAAGEVSLVPARRPYFFYSWSHDSTRLAALGPGSAGRTALDILDSAGEPTSPESLQGPSIYLAWEPDGQRLLLHASARLLLINDPDSLDDRVDFGVVGADFQAPAWVPGRGEFLYVDSISELDDEARSPEPEGSSTDPEPRLLRRGADSGEITSLGPVGGFTLMAVHPDGSRAALSLPSTRQPSVPDPLESSEATAAPAASGTIRTVSLDQSENEGNETRNSNGSVDQNTDDGAPSASGSAEQTQDDGDGTLSFSGSVEIVDLDTFERVRALDQQGLWLEWSPDGRHLLMATLTPDSQDGASLTWHTWDGERSNELARFVPTAAFVGRYLPFADQYTETPRLWSPDSTAIVFGAQDGGTAVSRVARLEGDNGAGSLGPADVSFWSPSPIRGLRWQ